MFFQKYIFTNSTLNIPLFITSNVGYPWKKIGHFSSPFFLLQKILKMIYNFTRGRLLRHDILRERERRRKKENGERGVGGRERERRYGGTA